MPNVISKIVETKPHGAWAPLEVLTSESSVSPHYLVSSWLLVTDFNFPIVALKSNTMKLKSQPCILFNSGDPKYYDSNIINTETVRAAASLPFF